MTFVRRNLLQLVVILGGGIVLLTNPRTATATETPGGCIWCRTSCPGSLTDYCRDKHCAVTSTSCTNSAGCQGVDGEWYTYKVTCGS
jgi:hypothetical protein